MPQNFGNVSLELTLGLAEVSPFQFEEEKMRLILAIPTGLVFAWLFVATWGSSQFWEVLFHWLAFGLVWFGWDRGKELLLLMWMNRRSAHSFAEEIVTAISTMLLIAVMVIMWLPFFAFDAKGAFWATLPRPAD